MNYGNYGGVNPQYYNPQLENRINQLQNYQYPQNTQFQQQYPQQPQMQAPQPQTPQNIIRPVTSLEEVRSITPNFDGSKMYFEDVTSGKVYIKYLGMNGLPVTDIFEKSVAPAVSENTTVNTGDFVSKSEFEELRNKVSQYENIFNELMGGNKVNE